MKIHSIDPWHTRAFQLVSGYRYSGPISIQGSEHALQILDELPDRGFAVVGSRYPQRRSFDHLETVIHALRGSRLVIISGFARGIDARAHELALENQLTTIAILGCGIDVSYPLGHSRLRRQIIEQGGLLISPYPLGAPALPHHFLERNQLIAGLSRGTWVVEAAEISGTLNTAHWANTLNRDLYATPCFPGDPHYQGNQKLLSQLRPDLYPIAEPLYHPAQLAKTWPNLNWQGSLFGDTDLRYESPVRNWIKKAAQGGRSCSLTALIAQAQTEGVKLDTLTREIEEALREEKIKLEGSKVQLVK